MARTRFPERLQHRAARGQDTAGAQQHLRGRIVQPEPAVLVQQQGAGAQVGEDLPADLVLRLGLAAQQQVLFLHGGPHEGQLAQQRVVLVGHRDHRQHLGHEGAVLPAAHGQQDHAEQGADEADDAEFKVHVPAHEHAPAHGQQEGRPGRGHPLRQVGLGLGHGCWTPGCGLHCPR
jgi:hypothetical protein